SSPRLSCAHAFLCPGRLPSTYRLNAGKLESAASYVRETQRGACVRSIVQASHCVRDAGKESCEQLPGFLSLRTFGAYFVRFAHLPCHVQRHLYGCGGRG